MSSHVSVRQPDLTFVQWALRRVEADITTWGLLTANSRASIRRAIADVRAVLDPVSRLREAELTAAKVLSLLSLLERLSSALHSARTVMTDDRRRALGLASQAHKRLLPYVQLSLFDGRGT